MNPYYKVPFSREMARLLIPEVLTKADCPMQRHRITNVVYQLHLDRGGVRGTDQTAIVKKALSELVKQKDIIRIATGMYRSPGELPQVPMVEPKLSIVASTQLVTEIVIGTGAESVYAWYAPNDKRLAEHKGSKYFELKIGHHLDLDPTDRILNQGATARGYMPIIAVHWRVNEAYDHEKLLHKHLRHCHLKVPRGGDEVFLTNPSQIIAVIEGILRIEGILHIEQVDDDIHNDDDHYGYFYR